MAMAKGCAWAIWGVVVWAVAHVGGGAPVGAPTPSVDCTSALLNLADCLSFVEEGSNVSRPEGKCCSGLKKVIKLDVSCLCEAFKGSSDFGVQLNVSKALTLPQACGVSTPPFSRCHIDIAGVPGAGPAPSPGLPLSGGGIRGVPAPSPGKQSTATASPAPSLALFASVAVAFYSCYF